MIIINDTNYHLVNKPRIPGALPRKTRFGETATPLPEAMEVIDWNDLKEVLETSNANKVQPVYHQRVWAPKGFMSNQDGLNLCWSWSFTSTMMDLRAEERRKLVYLAPVSNAWLVNWKNEGYFLDDMIRGSRERGTAPSLYVNGKDGQDGFNARNLQYGTYKDGWREEALKYRLDEVWDVDTSQGDKYTIRQAATILAAGRSLYIAYNWWGHALSCVGMIWDETKKNNVIWVIRNSHKEPDVIHMEGDKGVPDELYGIVSSKGGIEEEDQGPRSEGA